MTKVFKSSPRADGFHMPAEFEHHEGTILIWPTRPSTWSYGGKEARQIFLQIASEIALGEKVFLCAGKADFQGMEAALHIFLEKVGAEERELLSKNIYLLEIPSNDSWARDVGPTVVIKALGENTSKDIKNSNMERRGIDWKFNAWGGEYNGLYSDCKLDNAFALKFLKENGMDIYDASDFVMEGGAIHTDGDGTLVVTECCLLSKGRNPTLSKDEIEARLKEMLGVTKVIWLPNGIYNDETDGHVDNIFAFTAVGEAVLAWTDDENDPQYELSRKNLEVLEQATDAKGRKIKVHKMYIPSKPVCITEYDLRGLTPDYGEEERVVGERLAASYVNFYISNSCVLIPAFGDENDNRAAELLRQLIPDRKIVQIPARAIIVGGGNIHCITQQIPG